MSPVMEKVLLPPGKIGVEERVSTENQGITGEFEFRDNQGRLVFTVSPVGMDKMSPDSIESWQLVLPLTAIGNEVGDIAVSHKPVDSEKESKYFPGVVTVHDGDQIILRDKSHDNNLVVTVSIEPETKRLKLTPTQKV